MEKVRITSGSAAILAAFTVIIVIILVLVSSPHRDDITAAVVVDRSLSAMKLNQILDRGFSLLMGLLDPNDSMVIGRLDRDVKIVMESETLPSMEDIPREWLKPNQSRGTYPAKAVEYLANYAIAHPDKKIMVVFFTDGENDDLTGLCGAKLEDEVAKLVRQPNIIGIAVLGVDDNLRGEWEDRLAPLGEKAKVRGFSDYDRGLSSLIKEMNRELEIEHRKEKHNGRANDNR